MWDICNYNYATFTEQLYMSKIYDSEKEISANSVDLIKDAVESQMKQFCETHRKQLHELREKINEKEAQIRDLTE